MTRRTPHLATVKPGVSWLAVRRAASARAFSMVEMIVVIILIGILAAVALPRMGGTRDRAAAAESESVRQLMSSLGQRLTLSGQVVALQYEPDARRLSLLMQADATSTSSTTSSTNANAEHWKLMPLVRPVTLASTRLSALVVDGRSIPVTTMNGNAGAPYQLEFQPGRARPVVSIVLVREDLAGDEAPAYQIDLPSNEPVARVRSIASARKFMPLQTRGEDLDAAGKRDKAW
ncbi:MAG: prepilin-type N-terminal cleavage/methylation domain-containing protein [Phycisphaerales bacterium]|nr:prepilin-type N-terminal cleavage/methylation domain-containing protein [Phycisphaerales bacterium]